MSARPSLSSVTMSARCMSKVPKPPRGWVRQRPSATAWRMTQPSCLCLGRFLCRSTARSKSTSAPEGQRARLAVRICRNTSSAIRASDSGERVTSGAAGAFMMRFTIDRLEMSQGELESSLRFDGREQAAGIEQVFTVEQELRLPRAQRQRRGGRSERHLQHGAGIATVHQRAASADDGGDARQVLAVLHGGRTRGGIHRRDRAAMTRHSLLYRSAYQRLIERDLIGTLWKALGVTRDFVEQLRNLRWRKPRVGGNGFEPDGFDNRRGVMAHTQITFDRALDPGFGQPLRDDTRNRGLAICNGMHIGGCATRIDYQQRAQAGYTLAAIGYQPRAFHHRRRRGHQHLIELRLGAIDAFGVHDSLDEHVTYRGACRFNIEHVEFGHDVVAANDFSTGEHRRGFVRRIPGAGQP